LIGLGTVLLLAVSLQLFAPKAVHAVVSTLVTIANSTSNPVPTQQVIPGKPFFARLVLSSGGAVSVGPGSAGTLAVTNISISDRTTVGGPQEVFVFAPVFSTGGTCGDPVIGGNDPSMYLLVPQAQTSTLPYPTPLVFSPMNGVSCIAAESFTDSPVEIYITGFIQ
jgi:hypothetical protein